MPHNKEGESEKAGDVLAVARANGVRSADGNKLCNHAIACWIFITWWEEKNMHGNEQHLSTIVHPKKLRMSHLLALGAAAALLPTWTASGASDTIFETNVTNDLNISSGEPEIAVDPTDPKRLSIVTAGDFQKKAKDKDKK